jgi:hypothetical protein
MNTLYHAKSSVHKWGGVVEDYFPIHDFLDSTKSAMPDVRHRALLHNSFGIFMVERVFGHYITNSEGKDVPVREIAERHIIEDLGFIPTPQDWLKCISLKAIPWAGGHVKALARKGNKVNPSILKKVQDRKRS